MGSYKGKRALFLLPNHWGGLIDIPNYFKSPWKKHLHDAYKWILFSAALVAGPLNIASTLINSRHDLSEFLQRSLECSVVLGYVGENLIYKFKIKDVISLFDHQEKVFTKSNLSIYKKYARKENLEIVFVLVFICITLVGMIVETQLPLSERAEYLMTSIYHRKHPQRVLLFHLWTPSFIDTSERKYFYVLYLFQLYALGLLMAAIFEVTLLYLIPTPLVGQYEMLGEFVKMIGSDTKYGEYFYKNSFVKNYLVTEEHRSKPLKRTNECLTSEKFKRLKTTMKKKYEQHFTNQIIARHQQLNNFMNEYIDFQVNIKQFTLAAHLVSLVLAFYQMAYMKYLPWFNCMKILIEFLFIICAYYHFTMQSHKLGECNEIIARALYQSAWYNCDAKVKRSLVLMLRDAQRPKQLTLLGGLLPITWQFMLKIYKAAFTFINLLQMKG